MSRIIDADEAIPTLEGLTEQVQTEGATLVKALIFAALKSRSVIPTVDAVPVVHGRWVMDEDPHDGDVRCNVCLIAINQMHERNHKLLNALTGGKWYTFYNYCPHCGAKMDGGDADEHG